ncbi:MAG: polyprenyl diphosphate synthase [Nanoarchaeota archaeon]
MEEAAVEVYGRVQGIGFRNMIRNKSAQLGVKGFVKNRVDGSVLIVGQAEKAKLKEWLAWIGDEPGFSNIINLNITWRVVQKVYEKFEVVKDTDFLTDKIKSLKNLAKSVLKKKESVPKHVVIIPDGNRRWAREKGLASEFGHYKAVSSERIMSLMREAKRLGIKYLSFWAFSTENWKRDAGEIRALFGLLIRMMPELEELALKEHIRFRHIGRKDRLPKALMDKLTVLEEKTKNYNELNVQLCLDYGGRDEIVRAVKKIISGELKEMDEAGFSQYLDTAGIPDADMIIRTSGEQRTSGMMPYQSVYAELYFTEIYFPDFDAYEFRKAVESFGKRERRRGK